MNLFPNDLPVHEWARFDAAGFEGPVSGMLFTNERGACCGMPLGGMGTGCLDLETGGVWGFSSIFHPSLMVEPTPYQTLRNPKLLTPALGLSVDERVWVLADRQFVGGGRITTCLDPVKNGKYDEHEGYVGHWTVDIEAIEGVSPVESIRYWGHYPIADLSFETDAPVGVSARAWAPFIPGDATTSGIPGLVFEMRVENRSAAPQSGRLAFTFPGPHRNEVNEWHFRRNAVEVEDGVGTIVRGDRCCYAFGVVGGDDVAFGGGLQPNDWAGIGTGLPEGGPKDPGCSASAGFSLEPNESTTIRFFMTWHLGEILGGCYDEIKHFDETWAPNDWTLRNTDRHHRESYTPMLATRYANAGEVMAELSRRCDEILSRIVSWQQAVYDSDEIPPWLQDALVNNLALYAEDSLWVASNDTIVEWAGADGGFHMTESPRACAIVGCIASNYYGDLPTIYLFPDLERSMLRAYAGQLRPDGAVPFLWPPGDLSLPSYEWQVGLNGACFADLVHRLWRRTGDNSVVEEFYPAVRRNTEFTAALTPGPAGLISFHREGEGQEWWEHTPVFGMCTHLASVRLAHFSFARSLAQAAGDDAFAAQCTEWMETASGLMEEHLWNEETSSYVFYDDPENDRRVEDIMSSQLDGQWMVRLHGLDPVHREDRTKRALDTIVETCMVDTGVAGFAEPGKGPDLERYGTFTAEILIVAMTLMYEGQGDVGLEMARRSLDNLMRVQGYTWDLPNMIRADTGERIFGCDYYQNMVIWGLPAAMQGGDLRAPCEPGGLIDRMLKAGN